MRIGIVGGGLLGAGAALELALRGHDVELFEREAACLTQASRQNEGKIHLGFVYGQDPSLETARLMARGAYSFAPLLCRWLGMESARLQLSSPFHYLVHRNSLLSGDTLAAFYGRVLDILQEEARRPGAAYVDGNPAARCRRLSSREREGLASDDITDAYETSELAVDPEPLAALVRARLADEPRIAVHLQTTATSVTRETGGVRLGLQGPGGARRDVFDHVVNASWDGLLALDRTAGIEPRGPWSFRLKRYLRVRSMTASTVPSATIVLGAFGDLVRYDSGEMFMSWYPSGCTGLSTAIRHPEAGRALAPCAARQLRSAIHDALAALVPALRDLPPEALDTASVEGNVILALGTSDLDDPCSRLHSRSAVGVRSFGRYHSVDTGKWTTAPLFAYEVAQQVTEA